MNKEDLEKEAIRILNLYDSSDMSVDFTMHMIDLMKYNSDLFNAILAELESGKYSVRFLNSTGSGM